MLLRTFLLQCNLIVSWVEKRQLYSKSLQLPKQKFKTMLMQNFGGTTEILFPNMRGVGSPKMPHERWTPMLQLLRSRLLCLGIKLFTSLFRKEENNKQLLACSKRTRIPKMQFMLPCFGWVTGLYYLASKETEKRIKKNGSKRKSTNLLKTTRGQRNRLERRLF